MHVRLPVNLDVEILLICCKSRSIKVAAATHSNTQIVKNLEVAIPSIVAKISGGWGNIQSLHLKTSQSASLPIWTCDLASGERWSTTSDLVAPPSATQVPEPKSAKRRRDDSTDDAAIAPLQLKKSAPLSARSRLVRRQSKNIMPVRATSGTPVAAVRT